ncbi:MAG TPA: hypothetical protein VGG25_02535, partial [Streptosporangiaceae bacterium]
CPEDEKAYLHRIGRTGRAGRTGVAVTFVDWNDIPRWKLINEALNLGRPEPVETYSTSEHLFTELTIPAGATGILPRSLRDRAGLEAEQLEDIGETGRNRSRSGGSSATGRDDHSRGRSDGASRRGEHGGPGSDPADREPGQRRQRVRRRTKSGVQVGEGAAPAAGGAGGGTATAVAETGTATTAAPAHDQAGARQHADGQAPVASQAAKRRRRRRPSRPAGQDGSSQGGSGDGGGQGGNQPGGGAAGTGQGA